MKELHIETWCDFCASEDEGLDTQTLTEATTHLVALDGQPQEIDVCDPHWARATISELELLLRKVGRVPAVVPRGRAHQPPAHSGTVAGLMSQQRKGRQPAGERPYLCPWCPMNYASSQALLIHGATIHKVKTRKVHELFNGQCPLCGHATQVLNDHCVKEHGDTWGAVYRQALAAGDPTGLVTPVEKRAKDVHR